MKTFNINGFEFYTKKSVDGEYFRIMCEDEIILGDSACEDFYCDEDEVANYAESILRDSDEFIKYYEKTRFNTHYIETENYYLVNNGTGNGTGVYSKEDYTLIEAIGNQELDDEERDIADDIRCSDIVFTTNGDAANTMDYPNIKDEIIVSIITNGVERIKGDESIKDAKAKLDDVETNFIFKSGEFVFAEL